MITALLAFYSLCVFGSITKKFDMDPMSRRDAFFMIGDCLLLAITILVMAKVNS